MSSWRDWTLTQVKASCVALVNNEWVKLAATFTSESFDSKLKALRIKRERETVCAMIRIHCQGRHHRADGLCEQCSGLQEYALLRLDRCIFGEGKPTCANCPVHCYKRSRREQIKAVMRFAGPRMLWRHPMLAMRHWLDGFHRVSMPQRSE